jgi:hypothetical protein
VRKDQLSSGTARAEPTPSDPETPAQHHPAGFSAADRLWSDAWSAAADDGGWMVDDTRPDHPSGQGAPDILFVYPPASAGRTVIWRRANQTPYIVTARAAGVVLHDPVYTGLPARHQIFTDLRAALLSLAALTPALLSLVDALAQARADVTDGAELSVVRAFGRRNRGG